MTGQRIAKPLYGQKLYPGFESLPLRHACQVFTRTQPSVDNALGNCYIWCRRYRQIRALLSGMGILSDRILGEVTDAGGCGVKPSEFPDQEEPEGCLRPERFLRDPSPA